MLLHPRAALGLADGGAHCGVICDASQPTFMLTHWTRDRTRGEQLPLEWVVQKQTHDTARLYGLGDRGTLEPGMVADLNVIDYDDLQLGRPGRGDDLPAGGKRLVQGATGYVATIKSRRDHLRRRRGHRRPPRRASSAAPADPDPLTRPTTTARRRLAASGGHMRRIARSSMVSVGLAVAAGPILWATAPPATSASLSPIHYAYTGTVADYTVPSDGSVCSVTLAAGRRRRR